MNIFIKFVAYLQLNEAVRRADNAHAETGERFYVMPGADRKLIVLDRKNFRVLKRKNYIGRNAQICDLLAESFYFTPYINGDGHITSHSSKRKIKQFFAWYDAQRKAAKTKNKS